jgi:leucyl aminopeptidase
LTGAALIALGTRASAIMTRDEKLETKLRELGEKSGDYVWPFPLWKEYETDAKGRVGDIANISTAKNSRDAGVIMGGIFLLQFAGAYPWAHIDMAPRMESIPEDNLARGAAGAPVRLLVRVIEEY